MKAAFLIVLALSTSLTHAAEPPVKDGLLLHLNAASQRSLRQAAGLPGIGNSSPVDRWLDESGGARFLTQPFATSRPVFRADDQEAFIRFDGKDDFLSLSSPKRRAKELTVFILAAPRANKSAFSGLFGAAVAGQNDYTTGINQ